MVKRKIVWTLKANQERKAILAYWIERNRSKTYSIKLNKLIKDTTISCSIPGHRQKDYTKKCQGKNSS